MRNVFIIFAVLSMATLTYAKNPHAIKQAVLTAQCDPSISYLLLTVDGVDQTWDVPFSYPLSTFAQGDHSFRLQAVGFDDSLGDPIDFDLIITDSNRSITYELSTTDEFLDLFDPYAMTLDIHLKGGHK